MLKTKNGKELAVEQISWQDVVDLTKPIAPEFSAIIKDLDEGANHMFYKAKYKFGAKIIGNRNYYLPLCNGGSIAFDDPELPDALHTDLSYNKSTEDPLGLILNKRSELYLPAQDRIQSCQVLQPGDFFGVPRAIDKSANSMTSSSPSRFNLNAGARSILALPKISDQGQHSKLQAHFKTRIPAPKSFLEQWDVFVDIAKESDWISEIIFFPRTFINNVKISTWLVVLDYLMQQHRASYNVSHNISNIWDSIFNEIEYTKGLTKNYPMQSLLTAKHMFYLAAGGAPGLSPAINDDAAPVSYIRDAYINVYKMPQINHHDIVFMEPTRFNFTDGDPIYYSFNYSTFTQTNFESSYKKSNISFMDEIRWLLDSYEGAILQSKGKIDESLYRITKHTTFSCYHDDPRDRSNIFDAALLATEDHRFTQGKIETFPIHSSFFKGCIKISRKC